MILDILAVAFEVGAWAFIALTSVIYLGFVGKLRSEVRLLRLVVEGQQEQLSSIQGRRGRDHAGENDHRAMRNW